MVLKTQDWEDLLYSIEKKKCTPFTGAGASSPWVPIGKVLANEMAKDNDYPLEDSSQLSRVAQFVAIADGSEMTPKNILSRKLEKVRAPDFSLEKNRNTPYAVLADLNLPIYVTTNYDYLLEEALRSRGKNPVSEFCRWSKVLEESGDNSTFNSNYVPTETRPLVYHLHGGISEPASMVLTENDYVDFLIYMSRDNGIVPSVIRKTLANTTLLLIGYSLEDITFRVILKSINLFDKRGIAILRPPQGLLSNIDKYLVYMDQYTNHMFKMRVYWGDASDFSMELRSRLDDFKSQTNI